MNNWSLFCEWWDVTFYCIFNLGIVISSKYISTLLLAILFNMMIWAVGRVRGTNVSFIFDNTVVMVLRLCIVVSQQTYLVAFLWILLIRYGL